MERLGGSTGEVRSRGIYSAPVGTTLARVSAQPADGGYVRAQTTSEMENRRIALTVPQITIWLDQSAHLQKPIYNTGQTLTLRTPLVIDRFVEALNRVVAENDALRARFIQTDNDVFQEIANDFTVDLEYKDFSGERDPDLGAKTWLEALFWNPIGPSDFPLFKFALAKLASDHFLWLQKYHHLIIDATGRQLVAARVAAIYESLSANAAIAAHDGGSYAGLAEMEQHYQHSDQWDVDEKHWRARLADLPEPLIQTDHRRSERSRSGRPARVCCNISEWSSRRLRAFAQEHKTSLFRFVLCLVHSYFSRTYGKSDVIFGVPAANRNEAERIVGLFAKVVPFRLQLSQTTTFADALSSIGRDLRNDLNHQRFPGHRISRLGRSKGRNADGLYSVMVNYQRNDYAFELGGSPVTCANLSVGFATPWAITVFEHGQDAPLEIVVDYDPGLVESDEAHRFVRCFEEMLRRAPECAEIPIGRLPMIAAEEQASLFRRGQGKRRALPADSTLATLFRDQVGRSPQATALICGEERLTYLELNTQAERLARRLIALGVGPDSLVGVSLPRTSTLIIAVLAIHKAGGAYLPLDPSYPHDRLVFMLVDANATLILATGAQAELFKAVGAQLVLLDELPLEESLGAATFELRAQPDNIAYVIYTSGSTGTPKGAALTHGSAVNMVFSSKTPFKDEDIAGVLCATSLNFDMAVYEIFVPLAFGGAIILVDNFVALTNAPAKDEITLVSTIPSLMPGFLARASLPRGVRAVNLVGEVLPRQVAEGLFAHCPGVRLFNIYGPSEITVYATRSEVDPLDRRAPSIGFPILNTDLYVLDEHLYLVPDGAIGELWIGGLGVGRGYIGRPELTEQRFISNPFGPGRLYRTGDLVRWLSDGQLAFCGRVDQQVKINGIRIEPGEIEARLRTHPAIGEAVVTAVEQEGGKKCLAAYLLPRPGADRPDNRVICAHVASILPPQLVPAIFIWLDAVPRTPSGKIDRKALPRLKESMPEPVEHAGAEARNEIEMAVLEIWRDWFKNPKIGVNDDYFEIDGDSLDAFWLLSKCNERFETNLPLSSLFAHPSVERLAVGISAALAAKAGGETQPEKRVNDSRPLVVFMPGAAGDNLTLMRFRSALEDKLRFQVIEYPSWRETIDAKARLDCIIDSAIRQIRTAGEQEPCLLAGFSFGGLVAYEVACRLILTGHPVGFVGLIDTQLYERSVKLPVLAEGVQLWTMNKGLVGQLRLVVLTLLRLRAFSLLRVLSSVLLCLPSRLTADFHTMLLTQLQRSMRREWRPSLLRSPTTLFRAGDDIHDEGQDYGWGEVCESLTVVPIGGDHVSIVTAPHDRVLQASLLAAVQGAVSSSMAESKRPCGTSQRAGCMRP